MRKNFMILVVSLFYYRCITVKESFDCIVYNMAMVLGTFCVPKKLHCLSISHFAGLKKRIMALFSVW